MKRFAAAKLKAKHSLILVFRLILIGATLSHNGLSTSGDADLDLSAYVRPLPSQMKDLTMLQRYPECSSVFYDEI